MSVIPPMSRLLVVKLADIGDTLTITPALRAIRNAHPDIHIAALVTENGRLVLDRTSLADEIMVFRHHAFDRPLAALSPAAIGSALALGQRMRAGRFDTLLLLHHLTTVWGSAKYAALALASGAPRRVGLAREGSRRGWFLTHRVADGGFGARHEVEHWLAAADAVGAKSDHLAMEFPSLPEEVAWATQHIGEKQRPVVALYPGSGGYSLARRWGMQNYIDVGRELAAKFNARIVVIGGPDENELAGWVAEGIPGATSLAGQTTLGQLGALLQQADLFIGNDGGPMHLAAVVGAPVVAVFGPSNHRAWGPYTPIGRGRVVRVDMPCSPCLYVEHRLGQKNGCATMDCLTAVTPEMVLAAARELLAPRWED